MKAAPKTLACLAAFDPDRKLPKAAGDGRVDPRSKACPSMVGSVAMKRRFEPHHIGWNARSLWQCPNAPYPHSEPG
jgi:selenium-binding protein 1